MEEKGIHVTVLIFGKKHSNKKWKSAGFDNFIVLQDIWTGNFYVQFGEVRLLGYVILFVWTWM